MPLSTKAGLGTGHIVLHGDAANPPKGAQQPIFRPMSIVAKRSLISATAELLFLFVYEISPEPLNGFVTYSQGGRVWSLTRRV